MTGWPTVPFLTAVVDQSGGNVKTLQSDYRESGRFPIVDQGKDLVGGYTDDSTRLCRSDTPVIVFGDHTRVLKYIDFPFGMGADGVKVLQVRDGFDAKFVFHYLRWLDIPSAGYSRHYKFLKDRQIPSPPLDEQRRIAAILDQADALRGKRREALAHLDDLAQSIFLDVFGEPGSNPHNWKRARLGDLASKFSDGPFGSNLKSSHYVEAGVRVVRLQNIGVGEFIDNDQAYVSDSHFASLRKHQCQPGDVLVATLGDPNLRACIQPDWLPIALNKADCVQVRVDPDIATPEFVRGLINQPGTLTLAHSLMLGQTRVRISMGRLRELQVPVPPVERQREFVKIIRSVEHEKTLQLEHLDQLASVFASLQSRAFAGEL